MLPLPDAQVHPAAQGGHADAHGCGIRHGFELFTAGTQLFFGGVFPRDSKVFGGEQLGFWRRWGAGCFGYVAGHPHAVGDEGFAGLIKHLLGRAVVGDASAGAEHDHAVHVLRPHAHPVLHHDEGGPGVRGRPHHGLTHLLHPLRVEVGGGFIQQDGARVHRQDPGKPQALFLPAGEGAGGVVQAQVLQVHGAQGLADALPDFFARNAQVFGAEGHIVAHAGQHHRRLRVLLHEPHYSARIGGCVPVDACGTELAVPVIIVNNPR